MLDFHKKRDIRSPRLHKLVKKPVTTKAVRRFETSLQAAEIALIERELRDEMARYGYEPVSAGVAVPREFDKRLRERRKVIRTRAAKRWANEQYRRLTYRHPVAAR